MKRLDPESSGMTGVLIIIFNQSNLDFNYFGVKAGIRNNYRPVIGEKLRTKTI